MATTENEDRVVRRRRTLEAHGARGPVVEELLEFNRCRVDSDGSAPSLPLADEPHLEAWCSYADEAKEAGVWPTLREKIVQLQFPIRKGMSDDESYRRATRRGEAHEVGGEGLALAEPNRLVLEVHPSVAGTVPIISTPNRDDFVALVRAVTARGEPAPVSDSMGACMVSGLNNWDRVRRYRSDWEERDPAGRDAGGWTAEFRRLIPRKELYQDRLVILSQGPYSNVTADEMGLEEPEWIERSYRIRREHECTHYLTLRVFGRIQHNVLEELVADFVGTICGLGEFRSEPALRFLGLESFPVYRPGGRLEVYRGEPPISGDAFDVLTSLSHSAVWNLERLFQQMPEIESDQGALAMLVLALIPMTLEELADDGAVEVIRETVYSY